MTRAPRTAVPNDCLIDGRNHVIPFDRDYHDTSIDLSTVVGLQADVDGIRRRPSDCGTEAEAPGCGLPVSGQGDAL
ncbi:hypothetical protein [Micromonospora peucetia]|uniref:hypothetical protein n=1 Tax=Micromonospora peucetia TaxID=47871 RepID=UPI00114CFE38|nr:hypothetical protein [Micromonospora peucetia]